jgi:LCP family protein required for cell wall assembly
MLAAVLVAALVLALTGSGWAYVRQLNNRLTRADVISGTSWLGEQNILIVGLDTRTDAQGNPLPPQVLDQLHAGAANDGGDNTDTMIVVHIPAGAGKATGFSIPRDSYVQIADGYGTHKINSAYTYGQNAAHDKLAAQGVSGPALAVQSAAAGARTAIATVQQLTGLQITHYAAVNLAGFYAISNAVGGVPVCLAAPVNDSYSGAHFPAGPQTIQGASALAFVRQRHGLPGGDLDRVHRQQAFIASMAHTVLSAGTLTDPGKVSDLVTAVGQAVVLDRGWDVLSFATQMQALSGGSITFQTIPIVSAALDTPDDGQAVQVDPSQVQSYIQAAINPPAPAMPATPAPQDNAPTTVDVRNGSGTSGVAAATMATLAHQGFTAGDTGNAALTTRSRVDYPSGGQAAAEAVAAALGGGLRVTTDDTVAAGHLRVVLGTSYHPHSTATPPPAPAARGSATPPAAATASTVPCIN